MPRKNSSSTIGAPTTASRATTTKLAVSPLKILKALSFVPAKRRDASTIGTTATPEAKRAASDMSAPHPTLAPLTLTRKSSSGWPVPNRRLTVQTAPRRPVHSPAWDRRRRARRGMPASWPRRLSPMDAATPTTMPTAATTRAAAGMRSWGSGVGMGGGGGGISRAVTWPPTTTSVVHAQPFQ
jgi:hypothetical protein